MSTRGKWQLAIMAMLVITVGVTGSRALAKHGEGKKGGEEHHHARFIMAFGTMYGVDGPFIDPANAIRGIVGDEEASRPADICGSVYAGSSSATARPTTTPLFEGPSAALPRTRTPARRRSPTSSRRVFPRHRTETRTSTPT
jgi:hypothetical protein